jgi:hypothetical protein
MTIRGVFAIFCTAIESSKTWDFFREVKVPGKTKKPASIVHDDTAAATLYTTGTS